VEEVTLVQKHVGIRMIGRTRVNFSSQATDTKVPVHIQHAAAHSQHDTTALKMLQVPTGLTWAVHVTQRFSRCSKLCGSR
jgi:hypothetical protein